jgi:hypothetical protein
MEVTDFSGASPWAVGEAWATEEWSEYEIRMTNLWLPDWLREQGLSSAQTECSQAMTSA